MSNKTNTPPQSSLLLRILGGIYLVYLAWDMRSAIGNGPLFTIAVPVFAVIGALLAGHSIWVLAHHGYFRKDSKTDSTEDMEDESDE